MEDYDIYLMSDQPTTCPLCGNRTEIFIDPKLVKIQQHKCLSNYCRFEFLVEDELSN